MEGDIEGAYLRLEEAGDAVSRGDIAWARSVVAEVVEMLRPDESRLIATDLDALENGIDAASRDPPQSK